MDARNSGALLGLLTDVPYLATVAGLVAVLAAAWLAHRLARGVLLRVVVRLVESSPIPWDDELGSRTLLDRVARVVPALVLVVGVPLVPGLPEDVVRVLTNVGRALVVLALATSLSSLLRAFNAIYEKHARNARERPIKGYVQLVQLVVYTLATVLVIAALLDQSPLVLLGGLGAMTAVLMLVFKDTILGLVASVQLAGNDMLRVGDWIEMPSKLADGDVIDISLHTVKVRNWDKTITTIPSHLLISESFRNWRGMAESGGRRIKRSLLIDQSTVRFLTRDEIGRLRRFAVLADYLDQKEAELAAYNAALRDAGKDPINERRPTNLGTFRAYVVAYLRAHPGVHKDMLILVRQLQPQPTGLPLEVYCFSADVRWVAYENLASDIFDHLLAILPEFGLRVYQQPTGSDLQEALRARFDTIELASPPSGDGAAVGQA